MAIEKEKEEPFIIPEGKEVESCMCICDKHGDVTNSSFFFSYDTKEKDGTIHKNNMIFCSICISNYLLKLQNQGELGTISLVPILKDKKKDEPKNEEVKEENNGESANT